MNKIVLISANTRDFSAAVNRLPEQIRHRTIGELLETSHMLLEGSLALRGVPQPETPEVEQTEEALLRLRAHSATPAPGSCVN